MSNCAADTGGGLVAGGGCDVSLAQVTVWSCAATWFGGGVCLDSSQSSVNALFSEVSVSLCSAGQGGGGVYVYGGVLQANDLTVEQCMADNGAGIDAIDTVLGINVGSLRDNTASDEGGGVRVVDGSALLEHVTVEGNAAVYGGGVMLDWCDAAMLSDVSCSANDAVLRGGALYASGARDTVVSGCSVSSNTGGTGCRRHGVRVVERGGRCRGRRSAVRACTSGARGWTLAAIRLTTRVPEVTAPVMWMVPGRLAPAM